MFTVKVCACLLFVFGIVLLVINAEVRRTEKRYKRREKMLRKARKRTYL